MHYLNTRARFRDKMFYSLVIMSDFQHVFGMKHILITCLLDIKLNFRQFVDTCVCIVKNVKALCTLN